MKQIAQYQDGRLEIQEVPIPVPPPGGALVKVTRSVISIGTEKMKVEQAKMNLLQKVLNLLFNLKHRVLTIYL